MPSKVKKSKPKSNLEIFRSIRKGWGGVNPVERVEKSRKAYDRKKAKKVPEDDNGNL